MRDKGRVSPPRSDRTSETITHTRLSGICPAQERSWRTGALTTHTTTFSLDPSSVRTRRGFRGVAHITKRHEAWFCVMVARRLLPSLRPPLDARTHGPHLQLAADDTTHTTMQRRGRRVVHISCATARSCRHPQFFEIHHHHHPPHLHSPKHTRCLPGPIAVATKWDATLAVSGVAFSVPPPGHQGIR